VTEASTSRDDQRIARIRSALERRELDAVVCGLRANVLLLSGYWPVVGSALAIATRHGAVALIVPADESDLASNGWADVTHTFDAGSLDRLTTIVEAVRGPLAAATSALGIGNRATIGFEGGAAFDPSGYASTCTYGAAIADLLRDLFGGATLCDATECLAELRSVLTEHELRRLRMACAVAQAAYENTAAAIGMGMTELDVARHFRGGLASSIHDRCDGFAYCMSGPNSARAYAAFQQSSGRAIADGDFVLLHCNSYCDGFWTDITRTFCVGAITDRQRAIRDAIHMARRSALEAVGPGVRADSVDRAARDVLTERGFGSAFKHPTGHGVGFAAIDHNAHPRIHPLSEVVLEVGMVFNIEPAVYIAGAEGMRHCDLVVVTEDGVECLTPFLTQPEELDLR
jgi:Xaa-Pro aminopeptidase